MSMVESLLLVFMGCVAPTHFQGCRPTLHRKAPWGRVHASETHVNLPAWTHMSAGQALPVYAFTYSLCTQKTSACLACALRQPKGRSAGILAACLPAISCELEMSTWQSHAHTQMGCSTWCGLLYCRFEVVGGWPGCFGVDTQSRCLLQTVQVTWEPFPKIVY